MVSRMHTFVCVIVEIPGICMHKRNQNRHSILSGLMQVLGYHLHKCHLALHGVH